MGLGKFVVIIRKNVLLARRHYLWTALQFILPIAVGVPLMTWTFMPKGAENSTSDTTTTVAMRPVQSIKDGECQRRMFLYVNHEGDDALLNKVLEGSNMVLRKFDNVTSMYEQLDAMVTARDQQKIAPKEPESTVFGVEFKVVTNNTFSYVIHSPDVQEQDIVNLRRGLISETDEIQLVDLRRVLKVPDLHTIHCLNSRYRKETLATVRAAGEQSVSIAPVSVTKLSRMTEIDSLKIAAVAPLSMVVLLVAFNVSWDSKMKEPLIVMNAGRFSILLASIICNFFLTVLSVSIVFVVAVVFNEKLPIFVVFVALLLLALGSVIFGVLCGTVFPDAINSIKLAIVLWGLACYFGFAAPPIYERYWLVLANQVNIVAAFNNILQSCEYQELRGIPVSFSTVFAYTDIVNPGISFIFMAADIIMCLTALVCYELIDWADMYTGTHMWLSRKKLEQLASQSERHSWHQDEEVKQIMPDVDAEDVSKVWESNGQLVVYRFEIRAYPGEVSVLLGHDGSGKTTVLKMVCGLIRPTRGRINVCSKNVFHRTSFCRSKIGYCPESNVLYDYLTALEHLWLFHSVKRTDKKEKKKGWRKEVQIISDALEMDSILNKKSMQLTKGEKRKLCVAIAFIGGSRVLLLDEPTNGMDFQSRKCLQKLIEKLKENRTIILTTEHMEDAENIGQQLYVMYMGRTICSGDIQFVRGSFGSEYLLDVRISNKKLVSTMTRIEEGIKTMVPGSKVRFKEMDRIKIELPKLQDKLFPIALTKLEEEKQMGFVTDFRLTYGNIEETFLRMGESTEAEKCATSHPLGSEAWTSFRGCLFCWRVIFLMAKKFLLTFYHMPLILSQWLLPLFLTLFVGHKLIFFAALDDPVQASISFASSPPGRFVIYNPHNESNVRNLAGRYFNKMKHIQVVSLDSQNIEEDWLRGWPWVVGGMYIRQPEPPDVLFLAPQYVTLSELLMLHMAVPVLYPTGDFTASSVIMDLQLRPRKHHFDQSQDTVVPSIVVLLLILLTSSFSIAPAEEHQTLFKRQQIMTGLSTGTYWFASFLYDAVTVVTICTIITLFLELFHWEVSLVFQGMMCLFCVINLPLAYFLSAATASAGVAYLIMIAFQGIAFIPLGPVKLELQSPYTYVAFACPSVVLASNLLDEMKKRNFLKISQKTGAIVLAANGLFYTLLLVVLELGTHRLIYRLFRRPAKNVEPPAIDVGDDVADEKNRLNRPSVSSALVLKDVTVFRGKKCCLQDVTFGVEKNEKFGLVGVGGSGRTTAFEIVAGHLRPSTGTAVLSGCDTYNLKKLGCCTRKDALHGRLTCRQNIMIIVGLIGYRNVAHVVDLLIGALGMKWGAAKLVANCSSSQKRRISVGLALLTRSRMIVIDEPTRGVDPVTRRDIWRLIATTELNDRTLFFTSSSIEECEQISDRYGILCEGRLVAIGSVDALRAKYTRMCILELEVVHLASKEHVVNTVRDVFHTSVPVSVPDSGKLILRWHIPMAQNDLMSMMFTKMQNLVSFLPVSNVVLTQSSYDLELEKIDEKFSAAKRKSYKSERGRGGTRSSR